MAEPAAHVHCSGCGNTTFRIPLEHNFESQIVFECVKCGVVSEADFGVIEDFAMWARDPIPSCGRE